MDLRSLSDAELDELRINVLDEQERRAALASIPTTVAELAARYKAGGGDPAALRDAVEQE